MVAAATKTGVEPPRYSEMVVETPTEFRVSSRVYTSPQVFEDEMTRIFESTWIYVAHESQIAQPGDYVSTYMGRQPVIVSRGEDGQVHVLLNACRHRGNTICREERGNAAFFRCSYHGWVYKNSGELVGIVERLHFPDDYDKDIQGLVAAPRVGVFRGLIFASLSADVPSLDEHLGTSKKYLNLWADLSPTGTLRVLEPYKMACASNWKFHVENTTEGYHARFVHESAFNTMKWAAGGGAIDYAGQQDGRVAGHRYGHSVMERPGMTTLLPPIRAKYAALLAASYGEERAQEILYGRNLTIFPNLALLENGIRTIYPISVDRTEVYYASFHLDGVPDEINADNVRDSQYRRSSMGFITPDDFEMFVSNQAGTRAQSMDWLLMAKGIEDERVNAEGEYEGAHIHDELGMRAMYREWVRLMRAPEAAS